MDANRTSPVFGAVFALNMLVGADSGDTHTAAEVEGRLAETGFTGMETRDTGQGTALVTGQKAG
jgi:hypothetical protein